MEYQDSNQPEGDTVNFLRWHLRLGHASPAKIKALAKQGILPKALASCHVPLCNACIYGKAARMPCRHKSLKDPPVRDPMASPGQCVSVDHMASSTPGLIGLLQGTTKLRYNSAAIFVDQYSGLSYVHLQTSTSEEETI